MLHRSHRAVSGPLKRLFGTPAVQLARQASSVQTSTLNNGVTVISKDDGTPFSQVNITVGFGSRDETAETTGLSHLMRHCAFLSTSKHSTLAITRESELNGRQLSSGSNREEVRYTAVFQRNDMDAASVLANCVAAPNLHDWEVSRQRDGLLYDATLAAQTPEFALADDIHRLAFRASGLGQSTVANPKTVGKLGVQDLQAARKQYFVGSNVVVSASGVDHDALVQAVADLESLPTGFAPHKAATYYGGQSLRQDDSSVTRCILAFKGVAAKSPDAVAVRVLQYLIGGNGSGLKWSQDGTQSRVSAAVGEKATGSYKVNGFATIFKDAGLFGVYAQTTPEDSNSCITALGQAVKSVLSGDISEEDLNRAKAQLTVALYDATMADDVSDMASQVLTTGTYASVDDVAAKVASVSVEDIKKVAKAALDSRSVFACSGNVDHTPYLEDLQL